jgi:uncharacterized protein YecE (DUF72 family)
MVEHDMPASATPHVQVAEYFTYLRFHGPDGKYKGSYDDTFLASYASRIAEEVNHGHDVYVYFNNTMGDALGNLQTLNRKVSEQLH